MNYAQIDQDFYCGVDLHAEEMFLCVLDRNGHIHYHQNHKNTPEELEFALKPYLGKVALGVESTFNWYWLANACRKLNVPFYLGHALYMRAIHGGKKKNDELDSKTIANLMRTRFFPLAYAYPEEMRATRDLLRRRTYYVRLRASAYTHVRNTFTQQGLLDIERKEILRKSTRAGLVTHLSADPCLASLIELDFDLMTALDVMIDKLEKLAIRQAQHHDRFAYELLQTIPGVGPILAMVILYEVHTIRRFASPQDFSSYCRLVRPERSSAGKPVKDGSGNSKIGNPYLKWAFSEVMSHSTRSSLPIRKQMERMRAKYGPARARSLLAHRFGVAVYYMLKNGAGFSEEIFLSQNIRANGESGTQLGGQVRTSSLALGV